MDDDFALRSLIENQKWIWQCRQTANDRIIRASAHTRMQRKKFDQHPNAILNALRASRGLIGNVIN